MRLLRKWVWWAAMGLLVAALILHCAGWRVYRQRSSSMSPTIRADELVLVERRAYAQETPSRWDIVVYQPTNLPDCAFLSRVVGLPGESIQVSKGQVLIGGSPLAVPPGLQHVHYVAPDEGLFGCGRELRLAENAFFLLSDNSEKAIDSRFLGPVGRDRIIGKAHGGGRVTSKAPIKIGGE